MTRITITLTEDQALTVNSALYDKLEPDFSGKSEHNAYIQRIMTKLAKAKSV